MINKYVAIGLGVLIALEPLAAVAQTVQLARALPLPPPPKRRRGHSRH